MRARHPLIILGGALAFLMPLLVYLNTMSPTLNFWDAGEFITTSFILGIPHPPATPMYVLVGRLASVLPIGVSVAHKINIMSAFFGALASLMMYLLVLKSVRAWIKPQDRSAWILALGGLVAAWFIAFSDTFWINSIEAEVYSLSAFLMGFTLWLILDWSEHADKPRGNALVYLILYLLSLAVGFHLGTILVFPGFFVLALLVRDKSFNDFELWVVGLALILFLGSAILHMPDQIMLVGLSSVFILSLWAGIAGLKLPGRSGAVAASSKAGADKAKSIPTRFIHRLAGFLLLLAGMALLPAFSVDVKSGGFIVVTLLCLVAVYGGLMAMSGIGRDLLRWAFLITIGVSILPVLGGAFTGLGSMGVGFIALLLATGGFFLGREGGSWAGYQPGPFGGGKRQPFMLGALGLFLLGLSVHLFLYIRAGQNPAINEADPSSWGNLWAVLKREQYPFQLPTERKAPLLWQFGHFFQYFVDQFRMPTDLSFPFGNFRFHSGGALMAIPIGMGLMGIYFQLRRHWRHGTALVSILLLNSLGLIFFLNFSSEEVRDRDYFYANGFYFFALFIGLGAVALIEMLRKEKRGTLMAGIVAPLILLASLGPLAEHWYTHDRSENRVARDYAYNMLVTLEPNAVIFTNGDNDTFPLWYIQEVEGFRKDVRVVNLSLLNTDWYMKQLRDQDPQLPIAWTDTEIDEVATYYVREPDGRIRQPRDYIIQHMFVSTQRSTDGWDSRPFYFAVTVPRETLRPFLPYLSMEGMVYRMTLEEGNEQVDLDKLRDNLENVFEWRGILTREKSIEDGAWAEGEGVSILDQVPAPEDATLDIPDFFKDRTTNHLIQNYAAAWSRLAIELDRGAPGREREPEMAVRSMEMAKLIRDDLTPVMLYLGYLQMRNGEYERAVKTYEDYLETNPEDWQLWARYAQALEGAGAREQVVEALGRVIQLNPDYEPAYLSLVDWIISYFPSQQNIMAVRRQLQEYLSRHPESAQIRRQLELIDDAVGSMGQGIPDSIGGAEQGSEDSQDGILP